MPLLKTQEECKRQKTANIITWEQRFHYLKMKIVLQSSHVFLKIHPAETRGQTEHSSQNPIQQCKPCMLSQEHFRAYLQCQGNFGYIRWTSFVKPAKRQQFNKQVLREEVYLNGSSSEIHSKLSLESAAQSCHSNFLNH